MNFLPNVNSWVKKFLKGSDHHYSCYLPQRIGVVSSILLKLFFSGVKINPELKTVLNKLPQDAIIVYTTKYKSNFEYLFYYTCFRLQGLTFPQIGFDYQVLIWQPLRRLLRIWLVHILYFFKHGRFQDPYKSGYLQGKIASGCTSLLPLMGKRDFYRRFVRAETDPISYLIATQKESKRPIILLPLLIFFDKTPPSDRSKIIDILFGTAQKPGKLRLMATLFRKPDKIFFEVSDPLSLPQYLNRTENLKNSNEHLSRMLRRDLLNQINRHRKTVTGPIPKTTVEMKQNILTGNRLQSFMQRHAQRRKVPIHQIHKEANDTIDEIAAKYNPSFVRITHGVAAWLLNLLFEEVVFDPEEVNRVKITARKGPIIFIPCHKSHFDSLILSEMLYANNIPSPHIFAGKNLSFWPMGPLLRRFGAFFVRRTFSGAVFYASIFSEYIRWLLEEGFNIAVFIEGTRSRSGKLLQPQLGMLSILFNAFKETNWTDLTFEPVFIGYDRVPEEGDYLKEMAGKRKKPENFRQMIRARKILKKRFGKIYLRFATPISLKDVLQQHGQSIQGMTSKEQNRVCRDLGDRVLNDINRMGLITPHAVMASALLSDSNQLVSREELDVRIDTYMAYITSQQAGLTDSLANDPHRALGHVLQNYIQRKIIAPIGKDDQPNGMNLRYKINNNKRLALEYYKNSCLSFLVPAAFTALSILEKKAFQFSSTDLHNGYSFLQDLFVNEFTNDPDQPPAYMVRKNLKAFINDGILVPHPTLPDTYNLTSQGYRKLKFFAGLLEPLLMSYGVVLKYFRRFPRAYHSKKQRLKKIQTMGLRMLKRKEIERKEALSVINYENADAFFTKSGIKGSEDQEKLVVYDKAIGGYLSLLS